MPKRPCPFPQNMNQMKMHIDMRHVGKEKYQQEVFEKTQNMLLNGSIIASKSDNNNSKMTIYGKGKKVVGPAFSKKAASNKCTTCGNVTLGAPLLACDFCEKRTCSSCVRVCNGCEKFFCHVCSVINYDLRDEREFCLTCNN